MECDSFRIDNFCLSLSISKELLLGKGYHGLRQDCLQVARCKQKRTQTNKRTHKEMFQEIELSKAGH